MERIRQKRMQELMAQQGGAGGPTPEAEQAKEEQKQAAEEQRRGMLATLLQPAARDRRTLFLLRDLYMLTPEWREEAHCERGD